MNELVATWATPAGFTVFGSIFGFVLRHLIIKIDNLDKEIAETAGKLTSHISETKEIIDKRFLDMERNASSQALYVEKNFVTKEAMQLEMSKIDGRLGEIGTDVKEIRDLLMRKGGTSRGQL